MIAIVGLGVIGGSYAMALRRAGYDQVCAIDQDEQTLEKALAMNLICAGSTHGKQLLRQADLTILSIYPHSVAGFLREHASDFKPGSVITDATGVKSELARQIPDIRPPDVDFVMGHPMAGREKKGLDFASDRVFQGANYILTPTARNREENLKKVEKLALELGFRRVERITPEQHDEIIAFTSQLPHALAVALINSDKEGRDTSRFIGDSYRDLTRIANINAELWSELFLQNRAYLLEAIEGFEAQLDILKEALRGQDRETLVERFEESSRRRSAMS